MGNKLTRIKQEILSALSHVEAEDGLYFNNLIVVHEDEERQIVSGDEQEVQAALKELLAEQMIRSEAGNGNEIYHLTR